jgi:hypothetical protein
MAGKPSGGAEDARGDVPYAFALYRADLTSFVGIRRPEAFRLTTRPQVIAWRKV